MLPAAEVVSLNSVWYVLGDLPEPLEVLAAVIGRGINGLYRLVYNFPHLCRGVDPRDKC